MHRDELVRFGRNMHGHTHLRTLGSPYINVCVEYTSYAPVPLDLAWRMHQ
jgi:calcineurin-like phosphoesterase family protein